MKEKLKNVPAPLQRQIFIRSGLSATFLVLFIALTVCGNAKLALPCIGMMFLCACSAAMLVSCAVFCGYVTISGKCAGTGSGAFKKRTKYILVQTEEHLVRITLWQRLKNISVGAQIEVYVAKNTPVYEKDKMQLLYTYLAIDVKG